MVITSFAQGLLAAIALDIFIHRKHIVFAFWCWCARRHERLFCWMDGCPDCASYDKRIRKMLNEQHTPIAYVRKT